MWQNTSTALSAIDEGVRNTGEEEKCCNRFGLQSDAV